jgi:endonuclease III-like uncharacterized protein
MVACWRSALDGSRVTTEIQAYETGSSGPGRQGNAMGTAKATKAADKSQVCRKLVQALQKLYGKSVPAIEQPVLETMLFAVCLEDNRWEQAELSLKDLMSSYFDLNEIRVSSISELSAALAPLKDAEWKGLRIRAILRFVFESGYTFEFEKLRRQTQEQAVKSLKKIRELSPFVRDFILQEILGSHIVCLDGSMFKAARWLGLVPLAMDQVEAAEFLKGGLRKSEVAEFCHLLRCLATDPQYSQRLFEQPDAEFSMDDVMDRVAELQNPKKKAARPAAEPVRQEKSSPVQKKDRVEKEKVAEKPAAGKNLKAAASGVVAKSGGSGKSVAAAPATEKKSDSSQSGKSVKDADKSAKGKAPAGKPRK